MIIRREDNDTTLYSGDSVARLRAVLNDGYYWFLASIILVSFAVGLIAGLFIVPSS